MLELEESKKNVLHLYTVRDSKGKVSSLFEAVEEEKVNSDNKLNKTYYQKFKEIPYNLLSSAAESYSELKFSVLKEKYPNLKSMREFLTSDRYLGNNKIEIDYTGAVSYTHLDVYKRQMQV